MSLKEFFLGRNRPRIYEEVVHINEILDSLHIQGRFLNATWNYKTKELKIRVET